MAEQSEAFKAAVVDSKKLTSKPSNDDLLEIYGACAAQFATGTFLTTGLQPSIRSEQARTLRRLPSRACSTSRSVDVAPIPAPSSQPANPPQGKAKYNAWKAATDDGLTPEEAQEKYVAKVEEMKATYGYDADKQPEAVGGQ